MKCSNCGQKFATMPYKSTCSDFCHASYLDTVAKTFEQMFGPDKLITDTATGICYKVPIRDILERGVNQKDLDKYPIAAEDHLL